MKTSFAAIFGLSTLLTFATLNLKANAGLIDKFEMIDKRGISRLYVKEPVCNGRDHCVYVTDAYIMGTSKNNRCNCRTLDFLGRGTDVCEFPECSTVYVKCVNADGWVTVNFGDPYSSFVASGNAEAWWSSTKRNGYAPGQDLTHTSEPGDDLYVNCPCKD